MTDRWLGDTPGALHTLQYRRLYLFIIAWWDFLFAGVLNWRDAVPIAKLFARPAMRALLVALLYFGSFLAIGLIAKVAMDRFTRDTGSLSDIQSQAGTNRRKLKAFLLGAWRNED